MTRPIIGLLLTLALRLLVAPLAVDAQQPTNVPPIGMVSGSGDPGAWTIEIDSMPPGVLPRHSGKDCEISVIVRGKTS